MKNKLLKIAVCLGLIVACCSSCALSEKKQDEMSRQTEQQSTRNSLTSETATSVVDESNTNATTVEKVSGEIDKLFQKASKNKPVVTINGRVITEFEYSIFKLHYDYAKYPNTMERIIRAVLISQEAPKINLTISKNAQEEIEQRISWLSDEGSFTSEESERKYKMPKQELVEIVKGVMNVEKIYWDFEELFYNKLTDGTLEEIDPSLKKPCEKYAEMKSQYNEFKVTYRQLEDFYQKTLSDYIDLLKSRATIVEGS